MKKSIIVTILCSLVFGCSSTNNESVSASEFQREYAQVGMPQTMHHHKYLGLRNGRAYLEVHSNSPISGWSKRIISVDISSLDSKFADSLPKIEMKD